MASAAAAARFAVGVVDVGVQLQASFVIVARVCQDNSPAIIDWLPHVANTYA